MGSVRDWFWEIFPHTSCVHMHSLHSETFWKRVYDGMNRNMGSDVVFPSHETEPKSRKYCNIYNAI